MTDYDYHSQLDSYVYNSWDLRGQYAQAQLKEDPLTIPRLTIIITAN